MHPQYQQMLEQQAVRQAYEAKLAAGVPQARAWREFKKQWRKAYRRRLVNEFRYVTPNPRPHKPPGEIEKTCDSCNRIENRIECLTCGCFGTSWLLWLTGARTATLPRQVGHPTLPARVGLAAIRGYQRGISAHTPARCHYTPTCSQYGAQAVRRYGLAGGSRLTAARIHRCTSTVPHGTADPLP